MPWSTLQRTALRRADLPGEPAQEGGSRSAAGLEEVAVAGTRAGSSARGGARARRWAAAAGRRAGTRAAAAPRHAALPPAAGWWPPACLARWAGRVGPEKPRWCEAG